MGVFHKYVVDHFVSKQVHVKKHQSFTIKNVFLMRILLLLKKCKKYNLQIKIIKEKSCKHMVYIVQG